MSSPILISDSHREAIEEFRRRHKTALLVLLFTDVVGSTAIKQEFGESLGNVQIERHRRIVRDLLKTFPESMEVSTAGDSFFLAFLSPSDSVKFSARLHFYLRKLSKDSPCDITVRIGIHMGEVFVHRENNEGRVRDILGLQVDTASRIMSLAQGEQTLMSRSVFDNARSVLKNNAIPNLNPLSWLSHGPYILKGVEDAIEICEAGEKGLAVLSAPPDSEKAKSIAPSDNNLVVGWRPSPGTEVPTAPGWFVTEKMGEGGFGEVWKTQKVQNVEWEKTPVTATGDLATLPIGTAVAFKFCFDLAHARALRREASLFRLLQKKQSELKHTAKLIDSQLSCAPLYLAMEFIAGKNLSQWLKEEGATLKPIRRLQMMAPVAQTIHDIHDAGIIINDIKPSNIIVRYGEDGKRSFVLTDLGIGQVRDKTFLEDACMTRTTGFTESSLIAPIGSSGGPAGSLLYLAPELLEGQPPSVASDAYALGVTLLQVASGNARMAVSDAWRRQVPSRFCRHLIGGLIRGDVKKRPRDLGKLARKLQTLPQKQTILRSVTGILCAVLLFLLLFWCYDEFFWTFSLRPGPLKINIPANTLKAEKTFTNSIGMKFKLIPAGSFMMGSPENEQGRSSDEGPQHKVTLTQPYYMGIYEVTQEEYEKVIGTNPSAFKGARLPVESVSWDEAQDFCRKLSQLDTSMTYRLPTEAEWEYAARAGTKTAYYWGDSFDARYAWCDQNSGEKTHEVGTRQANPWGLFDISGNVWEWCEDWYANYPTGEQVDPKGAASGLYRVIRGGGWCGIPLRSQSAIRHSSMPFSRYISLGFRVLAVPKAGQFKSLSSKTEITQTGTGQQRGPQTAAKITDGILTNSIDMRLKLILRDLF